MVSHLLLMTVYALLVSVFFAALWRRDRAEQRRLFAQIFLGLMVGALLLGWLGLRLAGGAVGRSRDPRLTSDRTGRPRRWSRRVFRTDI